MAPILVNLVLRGEAGTSNKTRPGISVKPLISSENEQMRKIVAAGGTSSLDNPLDNPLMGEGISR